MKPFAQLHMIALVVLVVVAEEYVGFARHIVNIAAYLGRHLVDIHLAAVVAVVGIRLAVVVVDTPLAADNHHPHMCPAAAAVVAAAAVAVAVAYLAVCDGLTVVPSGPTTTVLSAVSQGHKCCNTSKCDGTIPDIPARVFYQPSTTTASSDATVHMIVGSTAYYTMQGPTPLDQTRSCNCSFNKTADGNPADFAADEYFDSPISFGNGTVISLVHTEFPGNRFNNSGPNAPYCTTKGYPECWTVTIGLVISHDWGKTFEHAAPPPHHLVASVPYGYNQTQLASGWGDPSNIMKHPTDGYYYAAIWNRHQVGLQAPGICMMRSNSLLDPTSWRAYSGKTKSFSVKFADPYTMQPGTEEDHVCTVTNLPAGSVEDGCAAHGLFYSKYLSKFVVTLGCDQARTPVFKLATSDDLVTWSPAQDLLTMAEAKNQSSKVVRGMNYPTFIDMSAPTDLNDPNYYTIGQHPYLYWVSIGDNPEDIGRNLLATPFTFNK
eukprot:m.313801 g.313801  ORF g.313801 m.313801 type:complete len:490 (+) comp16491_c9_seq37:198-1667(+)